MACSTRKMVTGVRRGWWPGRPRGCGSTGSGAGPGAGRSARWPSGCRNRWPGSDRRTPTTSHAPSPGVQPRRLGAGSSLASVGRWRPTGSSMTNRAPPPSDVLDPDRPAVQPDVLGDQGQPEPGPGARCPAAGGLARGRSARRPGCARPRRRPARGPRPPPGPSAARPCDRARTRPTPGWPRRRRGRRSRAGWSSPARTAACRPESDAASRGSIQTAGKPSPSRSPAGAPTDRRSAWGAVSSRVPAATERRTSSPASTSSRARSTDPVSEREISSRSATIRWKRRRSSPSRSRARWAGGESSSAWASRTSSWRQGGERRAQLVAHVGGEPGLALDALLELVDHQVERAGEARRGRGRRWPSGSRVSSSPPAIGTAARDTPVSGRSERPLAAPPEGRAEDGGHQPAERQGQGQDVEGVGEVAHVEDLEVGGPERRDGHADGDLGVGRRG